jgi:hypothetical protein
MYTYGNVKNIIIRLIYVIGLKVSKTLDGVSVISETLMQNST